MPPKAVLVISTFPDETSAADAAAILVKKKLCACATLFPVRSIYSWKGSVEDQHECAVFFKSVNATKEKLKKAIAELHSYSVPEIIELSLSGVSKSYFEWMVESAERVSKDRHNATK
jgi:periplasmic divalent cation tolerance protein